MPDYGHDLQFGSFITPSNATPHRVVELAQRSEAVGLDLVTFQDHPYQASFLDTSTLLAWVAARTERIRVAANVANLPLRPPAVLARASASLDLLSGGRFELGLGAGGFWDPIAAMGGRRLTPGQGVQALSEAIDVIRGIWDVSATGRLVVEGDFYSVHGAKRGPAPAHPIGIWLGAYKPKMLRLTGSKADGWLPSLGYLESLDYLAESNSRIDDDAAAAGREPRAIRRMLNVSGQFAPASTASAGRLLTGPPQLWARQLTDIALTYGTSTFIAMADDDATLSTFAQEVAPAVREAVGQERGTAPADPGGSTGTGTATA